MAQTPLKRNAPIYFSLSNPTTSGPQPKKPENWEEAKSTDASQVTKKRKPGSGEVKSSTANPVLPTPLKKDNVPAAPPTSTPTAKAEAPPSIAKAKTPPPTAKAKTPPPTAKAKTPPPTAKAEAPPPTKVQEVSLPRNEPPPPPLIPPTEAQGVPLPGNEPPPPPMIPPFATKNFQIPPMQTHFAGLVPAKQLPGGNNYQDELVIRQFAEENPVAFETLVGLYFQDQWAAMPWKIAKQQGTALSHGWMRNPRRMDVLAANPNDASIDRWIVPDDCRFKAVIADVDKNLEAFEAAILWWAKRDEPGGYKVCRVLRKAGWIPMMEMDQTPEWNTMKELFQMMEGEEKARLVAQVKKESPNLFDYCVGDVFCVKSAYKRKHDAQRDPNNHGDLKIVHVHDIYQGQEECVKEPESKKPKYSMAGRPTQFHNVPLEERAFDSKGNRLPWALEWPDDHPNARGQKRRVEEKGPFGKANRRKGSSRTRTATPAKKENPTLDSFEKALSFDLQKAAESPPDPNLIRSQSDINITSHTTSTANKDPTQVILFGYPTNLQWQAIRTFEEISFGIICEDYEREPPAELRRYPSTITNSPRHRSRPLTKEERALAFKYAGGANWVKVTFDSAAGAERVFEASPIQIHQHWVYAQPYLGVGPDVDEPIPMTEEERVAGKPLRKHPQRSTSSQVLNTQTQNEEPQQESVSLSSSTASSGTATAPDQSNLRHRNTAQVGQHAPVGAVQNQNPRMMRYFPDQPRTVLRPAHEAFLPQPTWWERQTTWLSERGLIPGEIIGNGPPTKDNGDFDYARASFYWRFFYWIDSHFGTDYCGLRED